MHDHKGRKTDDNFQEHDMNESQACNYLPKHSNSDKNCVLKTQDEKNVLLKLAYKKP